MGGTSSTRSSLTLQTAGSCKTVGLVSMVRLCVPACEWRGTPLPVCKEVCTQTCCVPLTQAGPHPTGHAVGRVWLRGQGFPLCPELLSAILPRSEASSFRRSPSTQGTWLGMDR